MWFWFRRHYNEYSLHTETPRYKGRFFRVVWFMTRSAPLIICHKPSQRHPQVNLKNTCKVGDRFIVGCRAEPAQTNKRHKPLLRAPAVRGGPQVITTTMVHSEGGPNEILLMAHQRLGSALGADSISTTDRLTRWRTILLWTKNIGRWSVAQSDSPSCLVKQPPVDGLWRSCLDGEPRPHSGPHCRDWSSRINEPSLGPLMMRSRRTPTH